MIVTPVLANGESIDSTEIRSEFVDGTESFDRVNPNGPPNGTGSKSGPPDHAGPDNGQPDGADHNSTNLVAVDNSFTANTSTGALLRAASYLHRLEPESQAEADAINDTLASINASLSESRSFRRADSEASFEHLKDAQKDLKTVAKETDNETAVENASRLLYEASALNSKRAIYHAELSFDRHTDAFPNHGQERKTDQAIINARAAFERGNSAVSSGTPRRGPSTDSLEHTIQSYANGITHHRTAWRHAERALETIAKHTEPRLTLRQGHAFEENGSIHVRLEAVVTDVRAHAFDEANVELNNGTAEPVEFGSQATISTATGSTDLDLGSNPENQTVTVTVTSSDNPNRSVEETLEIRIEEEDINWDLPAPDEYAQATVTDSESNVTVDVEGNGVHKSLISVANRSTEAGSQHRAGPMVRIVNETSFDQADVQLPINETSLKNTNGSLTIYKWDPSADERWHAVETDIDPDNLTATTTVSGFSYFTVVESGASQSYRDEASPGWPQLDDFQSVDGWNRTGSVSVVNGTAVLESRVDDDENDGGTGGGGSIGGGGNDGGNEDSDGDSDDGDGVNDPPEFCFPVIGCVEIPIPSLGTAALEKSPHDVATQSTEESAQLTRTVEVPDGAERVWFETRVKSSATDGTATIVLEGESDSQLAHLNSGDSSDWITEEVDLSAFEGEEVTVRIETQGTAELKVDYVGVLVDSTGSGFPDAVERLDLRMPVGESAVRNTPLNLDPNRADTSGNGLRDSEVVDIEWGYEAAGSDGQWRLEGNVTDAIAHPGRIDTTGDGLTDRQQLEGWEIHVIEESDTAQEMMSVAADPSDPRDVSSFFVSQAVTANPLQSDTDGDGLSDRQEFELGSDPEHEYTTNDLVTDDGALRDQDEDPTVYSTSAPDIEANINTEWIFSDLECEKENRYSVEDIQCRGYKYTVDLDVVHERFVKRVEIEQSGSTKREKWYDDPKEIPTGTVGPTFVYFATVDEVFAPLRGAKTTVTAEDMDGNERSEIVATKRSIGGRLAKQHPDMGQKDLGTVSGFTHAGAELPDFVRLVLTDPEEVGRGIETLAREYAAIQGDPTRGEAALWIDIAQTTTRDAYERQKFDNPHDAPDGRLEEDIEYCLETPEDPYCQFASGWFEGYGAYLVAEAAIGTKGISKSSSVSGLVDEVGSNLDSVRGLRRIDAPDTRPGKLRYRIVTDDGSPNIDAPAVQRHLRDDHGIKTNGGLVDALEKLEGTRHLEDLSSSEQAALAAWLSRSSDSSAARTFINELDDVEDVRNVLHLDVDRASELRSAFVRKSSHGYAEADDFGKFAKHADNLKGTPGLNSGPVELLIKANDPGNIQGAIREVRRADEIGPENIQRMSLEVYDGKRRMGELDIQRTNGKIVENKSSFGYRSEEINTQFKRKLRTMKSHDDVAFDGNTLEIRASKIGDEDLVQSKIREWENRVANTEEWDYADVTIEVVDESTGTTITS